MKYFDKILSEALEQDVKNTLKELLNQWGDHKNNEDKAEEIRQKIWALRTDDNADEFEEYINEAGKDNPDFIKAMKKKSERGDNLATWMLRHLVSKAEQT
ncbi:MAG: hypothetical protein M0R50_06930 [Candidatus Cloacimonetes bacterium]|jgi:hypothetical protein|nr:hypothetical protein [Candidatus Cloacimonadota bacterium]